jgi:hypothetical protein
MSDIKLPDGGDKPIKKPAIYLYAKDKPIFAEIKLDKLIWTGTVVPKTFLGGWKVLVHKDGHIIDLQPSKTNCSKLPTSFGFEYAQSACKNNNYPYLFWDGRKIFHQVPKKLLGWNVSTNNMEKFLTQKATEIGMNNTEKYEFVRFWTNEIKNYPATNFQVYFLQNEEVDNWIHLNVSPKPDSWNRIEVVFTPIQSQWKSVPYQLKKIKRTGFTLVEWGGIIEDNELKENKISDFVY